MFSYYGSKCKIAKLYPPPKHETIVEPFAGAAWYSVLYNERNVILNEKNKIIHGIWEWLINDADANVLASNKNFYAGDDIGNVGLCDHHKNLLGFCINRGSVAPKNIVQKWSCQVSKNPLWASTVSYQVDRIIRLLPKIKHWQIQYGDYKSLPNIEATWFIDPPYQFGGQHYVVNDINYTELAEWCQSRRGQVIICENTKADWMKFDPLIEITGQRAKTVEAICLL